MSDYIKTTDFAAKDTLPTDDPGKLIKGTEHGVEYDAIASASTTKSNKVSGGTTNNLIIMDSAGDLKDSTIATDGSNTITANLTGNCSGTALSVTGTGVITAVHIATDAVGQAEIAADAVTSSEIATNAVGSAEIASSAVGTTEIAANAVKAGEMSFAALTRSAVTSIGATAQYVIPAGLYNIIVEYGTNSEIYLEIRDSGGTWRRNELEFGGGLVLGDATNVRLNNVGSDAGSYTTARMA